jgi:hypothetical protein
MKYIDFCVQSILFVVVLVIIIAKIGGSDCVRVVLAMQLVVGTWQLLSSVISVGMRSRLYELKATHLIISALYLAVLFIFPFRRFTVSTTLIILMAPAWTLAIFYYMVTSLATFQRTSRQGSFLPHTSF